MALASRVIDMVMSYTVCGCGWGGGEVGWCVPASVCVGGGGGGSAAAGQVSARMEVLDSKRVKGM
jgi:hypothetical protein